MKTKSSWRGPTTLACLVLGLFLAGWLFDALLLAVGVILWYFYYGADSLLNGTVAHGPWMPFQQWFLEFRWILPVVGKKYRLSHTGGDHEWAQELYMPIHFLLTCVLLPLGPWIAWRVYLMRQ